MRGERSVVAVLSTAMTTGWRAVLRSPST